MSEQDFFRNPTPGERVRKTVWQQLLDTKVVLTKEPGSGKMRGRGSISQDFYGRIKSTITGWFVDAGDRDEAV